MIERTKGANALAAAHHEVPGRLGVAATRRLRRRVEKDLDVLIADWLIALESPNGALREHGLPDLHAQVLGCIEMNHFHSWFLRYRGSARNVSTGA